jgi:hypothetical protein
MSPEMEAARFNVYWYLSLFAPAVIMVVATYRRRKLLLWTGVGASLVATYLLCNMAVQERWKTRLEIAQTDEEKRYAMADGGNLVGTALVIAPFEAILYTSIWGVVGWRIWPRIHDKRGLET